MAFLEFAHILWEATKPTIVLTDNKSVTRFFQTKAIPPALWNACDYVLQFNFKIAHIAGSVNTAADFLSWLELKATEKICLKIREGIQTTRRGHLDRCCLNILSDFETYFLRSFKLESAEKVSCCVDWSSNVGSFKIKLHHIITGIPECWGNCLRLEKTGDRLVIC